MAATPALDDIGAHEHEISTLAELPALLGL